MALNGRHATRPRLTGAFNNSLRGGQASKPSSFAVSPTLFPEKLDEVSGLEDHRDFDAFSADTFQPGDEDIESLIDEEVEEDAQIAMTQGYNPELPLIQDGILLEKIHPPRPAAQEPPHSFLVPFPLLGERELFKVGRYPIGNHIVLPIDTARSNEAQLISKEHGFFYSRASGIYLLDWSTSGTFYGPHREQVPSICKASRPPFKVQGVGPLKLGDVVYFGSNNEVRTTSGMNMPYDGCAYRVSKVVGYIGSGTRTNHKRKSESTKDEDDTDGGSDNGGRNFGSSGGDQDNNSSSTLLLDSKLQGKSPEEATRILRGALKKFRKKCKTDASTIRGGDSNDGHHHASEAAACRTHAAAVGRQARRGKAEQARYNKMRQHQNRKEGRPGNQVQSIKHKKVIQKNVAGRKKHLLARLGPLPRDAGKSKKSSGANSRGRFQGEGGDPSKRKAGNGSTHPNPMPKK